MIRHHEMDYFDVPTSYFYNIIIDVILMKNENAIGDKWYTNFIKSNSFHDYLLNYLLTRLCLITCHEMSLIWLVMIYHLSLSAFSIINDTYLSKDTKIQWYIGLFYVCSPWIDIITFSGPLLFSCSNIRKDCWLCCCFKLR